MRILIILLFVSFNSFGQEDIERYKLYPTQNFNIHLKLDTREGFVYMVQRRSGDAESMTISIFEYKPPVYHDVVPQNYKLVTGRYKLYPTENMYSFLLQDVIDGYTYRVQWSFEKENRFIEIIDSEKFK